jgi:hypothetical protein
LTAKLLQAKPNGGQLDDDFIPSAILSVISRDHSNQWISRPATASFPSSKEPVLIAQVMGNPQTQRAQLTYTAVGVGILRVTPLGRLTELL